MKHAHRSQGLIYEHIPSLSDVNDVAKIISTNYVSF